MKMHKIADEIYMTNQILKLRPVRENCGANFCTHRMLREGRKKILFVPTVMSKMFFSIFFVLGAAACLGGIIGFLVSFSLATLIVFLVGAGFIWIGNFTYQVYGKDKILDAEMKKISFARLDGFTSVSEVDVPFSEICSLQVIKKDISDTDGNYYSYELNFVHKDGTRTNFLDHSDKDSINLAAAAISEIIGCETIIIYY